VIFMIESYSTGSSIRFNLDQAGLIVINLHLFNFNVSISSEKVVNDGNWHSIRVSQSDR